MSEFIMKANILGLGIGWVVFCWITVATISHAWHLFKKDKEH